MEAIEFQAFNPEPFEKFLSDSEKRRIDTAVWVIIGVTTVIVVAGIVIYAYEMNRQRTDNLYTSVKVNK